MTPLEVQHLIYLETQIARHENFLTEIEKYQPRINKPIVMVEKPVQQPKWRQCMNLYMALKIHNLRYKVMLIISA